jgi:hypothetical protein
MRMKRGQAAAFWSEKLAAHSASGVSAREFCQREGLALPSFYQWRRKLEGEPKGQRQASGSDAAAMGFVPVVIRPPVGSPIEIAFPCGATVRVQQDADLQLLQHVAACLLGVA